MATKRAGLRVAYCERPVQQGRGKGAEQRCAPPGWYVEANLKSQWLAYLPLRFLREADALRAAQALTAAGLNTATQLHEAGPNVVRMVACENLQW